MTQLELIRIMQMLSKRHNKRVFSLREISLLAGETRAAAGMSLLRAEKHNIVSRVRNLWLNMLDPPPLDTVAFSVQTPSYISFESALYRHGIVSQSPRGELLVATTLKPCSVQTKLGDIHYVHLAKKLFFGFDENRVALPEKAFLDMIYIRIRYGTYKQYSDVLYPELLNKKRLKLFLKAYPLYVHKGIESSFHAS